MLRALVFSIIISFSIFAQNPHKLVRISLNQSQNIESLQQLSLGAQINITPDSLSFTLPHGFSANQDLVVTNVGNEPLFVNLTESLPIENFQLTRAIQNTYL